MTTQAKQWETYQAGYREGYDNALAEQPFDRAAVIEECARVADAHKGSAAKKRRTRGLDMDDSMVDEIYAEERGEDIAAEMIATAIRALKDNS